MKTVYERAIQKFGKQHQADRALEELLELATLLLQAKRKDRSIPKISLIEEIADVLITLESLRLVFDISEVDLFSMKLKKLNRLEHYLGEN